MEALSLVIKGRIPSKKNSKQLIHAKGRPFFIPSDAHREWEEDACYQLRSQLLEHCVTLSTCSAMLTFFFPDNRSPDLTNKAESVMDALVKMEVIEDDNWKVVPDIRLKAGGVDRQDPRVEITLYYDL
jgi:Holliday junction resolvase RusA-like endonuclease